MAKMTLKFANGLLMGMGATLDGYTRTKKVRVVSEDGYTFLFWAKSIPAAMQRIQERNFVSNMVWDIFDKTKTDNRKMSVKSFGERVKKELRKLYRQRNK